MEGSVQEFKAIESLVWNGPFTLSDNMNLNIRIILPEYSGADPVENPEGSCPPPPC